MNKILRFQKISLFLILSATFFSCELSMGGAYGFKAEAFADNSETYKLLPSSAQEYIKNNSITLPEEGDWNIPMDFSEGDLIICGELHTITGSVYTSRLKLSQFFHKTYGIKYHLLEGDILMSTNLNRYLETGDLDYITFPYMLEDGRSPGASHERVAYFEEIYQYNQTLPEDNRISFIGVDIIGSPSIDLVELILSYFGTDPPLAVEGIINEFLSYEDSTYISNENYERIFGELQRVNELNRTEMQGFILGNFPIFCLIVDSVNRTNEFNATYGNDPNHLYLRDQVITENVIQVTQIFPEEKMFGQWGSYHIRQKSAYVSETEYFPAWVEQIQSAPFNYNGTILTIEPKYMDCVMRKGYDPAFYPYSDYYPDIFFFDTIADTLDCSYLFIDLTEDGSPFLKDSYCIRNGTGGVTTDYFQYILFVQNSDAVTWW